LLIYSQAIVLQLEFAVVEEVVAYIDPAELVGILDYFVVEDKKVLDMHLADMDFADWVGILDFADKFDLLNMDYFVDKVMVVDFVQRVR
jgi:hypothetical protein